MASAASARGEAQSAEERGTSDPRSVWRRWRTQERSDAPPCAHSGARARREPGRALPGWDARRPERSDMSQPRGPDRAKRAPSIGPLFICRCVVSIVLYAGSVRAAALSAVSRLSSSARSCVGSGCCWRACTRARSASLARSNTLRITAPSYFIAFSSEPEVFLFAAVSISPVFAQLSASCIHLHFAAVPTFDLSCALSRMPGWYQLDLQLKRSENAIHALERQSAL